MRYQEFQEAGSSKTKQRSQRSYQAVLEYLQQFDPVALESSVLIHQSSTPKIGFRPQGTVLMHAVEPLGIYTYTAAQYIQDLESGYGPPYGHGFPYVTVIELKPRTTCVDLGKGEFQLMALLPKKEKYTPAQVTHQLRQMGYGCAQRRVGSRDEFIILGTEFIKNLRQFVVEPASKQADAGWDMDQVRWQYSPEYLKKLRPYSEFIQHNDFFSNPDGDMTQYTPRQIALIKLLKHAVDDHEVLSKQQEAALATYRGGVADFWDFYLTHVLEPQGKQPQLSSAELEKIPALTIP